LALILLVLLVPGKKYPNIERENRDNTGIINDISGIFQGYFRGKTSLWGPVYTVNRGGFGENCPKWRLITSMFGYFLPGTSTC